MLTFNQAVDFLSNVLGIENVIDKVKHERLQLLTEYMEKFHQQVPFQNLTLLELEVEERDVPSMTTVIKNCLTRIGGMCCTLNTFTNCLLQTLGFESSQVLCQCSIVTSPNTHVSTVVKNVEKEGDLYIVDVGTSFPTFQPIPIDELPKEYHDAFLHYKYVKEGNMIVRYHASTSNKASGWYKYEEFDLVPRDEEYLQLYQNPVYTKIGHADSWYLTGLRMTLYPKDRAITLNDYVLKLWNKEKGLETIKLKDKQEIETAIRTYFPMVKNVIIAKALSRIAE